MESSNSKPNTTRVTYVFSYIDQLNDYKIIKNTSENDSSFAKKCPKKYCDGNGLITTQRFTVAQNLLNLMKEIN